MLMWNSEILNFIVSIRFLPLVLLELWNIEILSFIAGIILMFVALTGGGLKVKEIEIPTVSKIFRWLCAIAGIVFIVIGVEMHSTNTESPESRKVESEVTQTDNPESSNAEIDTESTQYPNPPKTADDASGRGQKQKVYCPDCTIVNFKWTVNGTQYNALLFYNPIKGYGKMRVKYTKDNSYIFVQEEMYKTSVDQIQFIKGENPFNLDTGLPDATYTPDNLVIENGILTVVDANGVYDTEIIEITDIVTVMGTYGFTYADVDF